MSLPFSTLVRSAGALALLLVNPAWAGVIRIADQPGLGAFTSLQAAIDAAPDGGLLLVEAGNYGGATIDGKSLSIIEMPGAFVSVTGGMTVKNLASNQRVLLSGLDVRGPGLVLLDDAGHVRAQDCVFKSSPAVRATSCQRVVFASCTLTGLDAPGAYGYPGEPGGAGLDGLNSAVALFDCTVTGGKGGEEGWPGGTGGDGCHIVGWGIVTSGSTIRGGWGGSGDGLACGPGGQGGDGIEISGAQAQLLDTLVTGGLGGMGFCAPGGGPGMSIRNLGAVVNILSGARRKLTSKTISSDDASLVITLEAPHGDQFFLVRSRLPGFQYQASMHGLWAVSLPHFSQLVPLGTVPANGTLVLSIPLGELAGGNPHQPIYLQGYCLDAANQYTLTSPLNVELLDRDGGSDCNGNGTNDFVDLLEQLAPDCNRNLAPDACDIASNLEQDCNGNGIPDSCDIAAHTAPDCNANGIPDGCDLLSGFSQDCNSNNVPDSCDIASGTSLDSNGNGIPDECESHVPTTLWVDAAAPPGGNGSSSSPFQSIQSAIAASFHGDTVMIRDGVYSGPANRNLDSNGREIVIRSRNGPAACVIDLQSLGRAFSFKHGESANCRLEGLTIRNGKSGAAPYSTSQGGGVFIASSNPTIQGCVFEDCTAMLGGGVYAFVASPQVRDCVFLRCTGVPIGNISSRGGGMFTDWQGPTPIFVVNCEFTSCSSSSGGGLQLEGATRAVVSHCRFNGNHATGSGGAVAVASNSTNNLPVFLMEDCQLIDNSAIQGGGIWARSYAAYPTGTLFTVASTTFYDNFASGEGGGFFLYGTAQGVPPVELLDTVLWGNFATTGENFYQQGGATTVSVFACDVMNGQPSFVLGNNSSLAWGANNIIADPQFVDVDGPDNILVTYGDNDYRLALTSPCIDAGDNSLVPADLADIDHDGNVSERVPLDLDGFARFEDIPTVPDTGQGTPPLVDMGAHERKP